MEERNAAVRHPLYDGSMTITAAADGSSLGNPGPSGWAWVISEDCWDAGGWAEGTNNLGELTAILQLLVATREAGLADEPLHIQADSQYAINVVSKWMAGWKKRGWTKADKQPIKNLEVIQKIDQEIQGRQVTFEWVKGHAGHPLNERADDRARECAQAYQEGHVPAAGPGFSSAPPLSEGSTQPQEPAASSLSEVGAPQVLAAEKAFIKAWLNSDNDALTSLAAPTCQRIWHNGFVSDSLAGHAPAHFTYDSPQVTPLSEGAWLVTYSSSWTHSDLTGHAHETSIWVQIPRGNTSAGGLRLVLHQSTERRG